MASIVKRKNKFSVVYTYTDDKGDKRQKWETFATNAEAKRRKAEVEFQQESGTLVIPEAKTVKELLEDYTSIYGVNTWAMSTYEARRSLIFNYINPILGDVKLSDLNTRMMEKYYQNLLKVKSRVVNNRKPNTEYLSCHTVREVHKLLRSAFNQAVKWELMTKNPCVNRHHRHQTAAAHLEEAVAQSLLELIERDPCLVAFPAECVYLGIILFHQNVENRADIEHDVHVARTDGNVIQFRHIRHLRLSFDWPCVRLLFTCIIPYEVNSLRAGNDIKTVRENPGHTTAFLTLALIPTQRPA